MRDTKPAQPVIGRVEQCEKVSFGPLSYYRKLVGGDDLPIFTGIQNCQPGYAAPVHSHPYTEVILVLEGEGTFWFADDPGTEIRLKQKEMIALPPERPHAFRNAGTTELCILGIHCSGQRVVNFADGRVTGPNGYQVFDPNGNPILPDQRRTPPA